MNKFMVFGSQNLSVGAQLMAQDKVLVAAWDAMHRGDLPGLPRSIELQPTTACNYDCPYCSYTRRRQNARAWSRTQFVLVATQLASLAIPSIYISGGGEPTLAPGIERAVEILYEVGTDVALVTNGSRADRLRSLAPMLRYVLVHFASTDPGEHARVMGAEIAGKLELPDTLGEVSSCAVGARLVVGSDNLGSTAPNIAALARAGYDFVIVTPRRDYESPAAVPDGLYERLTNEVRGVDVPTGFVQLGEARNPVATAMDYCAVSRLGLSVTIDPGGDCYICVPDISHTRLAIGNVFAEPFERIWGSRRHREVIDEVSARYASGNCRNCRFISINEDILAMGSRPQSPPSAFRNFV